MDASNLDTIMKVAAFEDVRSLNKIHGHLPATELKAGISVPGGALTLDRWPSVCPFTTRPQRAILLHTS
jgi:hypothetical protein